MEAQVDGPIIIATLLILAVLISSAILWIRQVQRPREIIQADHGISSWPIGWVNFGIFICAMIIAVFFVQNIGVTLLLQGEEPAPTELTPWLAVAAVLLLQVPMLAVYYGARRFYPGHYAGRLSDVELPLFQAFKKACRLFIMLVPIVWIATLIWSNILLGLESAGLVDEVKPQQLITLFEGGGDLLAIVLLVVMAVILAPFVEEIIFRGCIYRFLKSKTTIIPAQLISASVFAMLHANLLSFVPLVVVGVFLARVYEKTGNLWVAIWFHAFFNAFSLLMLFITSLSETIPV